MQADDRAISLEFPFLSGDDVASRLVRAIDWAATPLGPIAQWPAPLRTMLGTMLRSRNPMLLYWGPQLTHFFNAAFIPSLDKRQFPGAMGQPGEQATMFFRDPSGNPIEVKGFADTSGIFAR